jgi:hypothetical protein
MQGYAGYTTMYYQDGAIFFGKLQINARTASVLGVSADKPLLEEHKPLKNAVKLLKRLAVMETEQTPRLKKKEQRNMWMLEAFVLGAASADGALAGQLSDYENWCLFEDPQDAANSLDLPVFIL